MSSELTTRIWWNDPEKTVRSRLLDLIQAFEAWKGVAVEWSTVVVKRNFPGNEILRLVNDVAFEKLISAYQESESDKITAYTSFPCWRFHKDGPEWAGVMAAISCWGNAYGQGMNFRRQFEGHAELTLINSAPFFGYLDRSSDTFPATLENEKVGENLEALMALLQEATAKCNPAKWLSYSDEGSSYIPINAHIAFYDNLSILLEEVIAFKIILLKGQADEHLPPVESLETLLGTGYHHSFRTEEQENELLVRFKKIAASTFQPDISHLKAVLATEKYDFFNFGEGFLVLDYPFFLNSLLQDFFLELLEEPV